jgi:TatD DNase family protein
LRPIFTKGQKFKVKTTILLSLPEIFRAMYIDTHSHLYLKQFKEDIEAVVDRAKKKGVEHVCLPNIDQGTTKYMLDLESRFPGFFSSMMGVHPGSVKEDFELELEHVYKELSTGKYVAVGEIGTDLYWDKSFKEQQVVAFEQQIQWALQFNLPIVIHARESMDLTIDIVERNQNGSLAGVFHCFTGTPGQAERIMDLGFFMGIGGVLTYPKAGLKEVVSAIPIEHLVLETDAPFLPPVPHRGKRNESAYVPIIAQHLADTLRMSVQEVAEITTENAKNLFKLNNCSG